MSPERKKTSQQNALKYLDLGVNIPITVIMGIFLGFFIVEILFQGDRIAVGMGVMIGAFLGFIISLIPFIREAFREDQGEPESFADFVKRRNQPKIRYNTLFDQDDNKSEEEIAKEE